MRRGCGPAVLTIGVAGILFTMFGWWRDVVLEAQGGYHNVDRASWPDDRHDPVHRVRGDVLRRLVLGVFRLLARRPDDPQVYGRLDFTGGLWPPKGTDVLDPLKLPLMNTFVLLTSSAAVNVAHDDLREGNRQSFKNFLALGIALGVLFVITQAYEYIHAPFSFKNSIYGATFFMATGFHGAHVIIGVIFLFRLPRARLGRAS